MSKQEVILCEDLESSLKRAIDNCPHDRLFILTDDHTHRLCLSQLAGLSILKDAVDGTFKTTFQIFTKDDFLFTHNGSMFFYVLQR